MEVDKHASKHSKIWHTRFDFLYIMLAKRQYYHTAFNTHSNNLKKTWKTINDVLNRNNKKHNLPISFK